MLAMLFTVAVFSVGLSRARTVGDFSKRGKCEWSSNVVEYKQNKHTRKNKKSIRDPTMVRKLKFHEQKLLKKVDFISWKVDNNLQEVKVMRKFHIQKREDYTTWVEHFKHNIWNNKLRSIIILLQLQRTGPPNSLTRRENLWNWQKSAIQIRGKWSNARKALRDGSDTDSMGSREC